MENQKIPMMTPMVWMNKFCLMNTKQLLVTVLFLLSFSVVAQEDTYQKHVKKAMKLYRLKKYDASTNAFAKAFDIKQNNNIDLYNGACSASLAHNTNQHLNG